MHWRLYTWDNQASIRSGYSKFVRSPQSLWILISRSSLDLTEKCSQHLVERWGNGMGVQKRLKNSVRMVKIIRFYSPVSKSFPGTRVKAIRAAVERLTEKCSQDGKSIEPWTFWLKNVVRALGSWKEMTKSDWKIQSEAEIRRLSLIFLQQL